MTFPLRASLAAAVVAASLTAAPAVPAHATVDAFIPYVVPYRALQTDDVCLADQTMWAELGIPPASQMEALLAPVYVYRQGGEHVDINLLAGRGLRATYVNDTYDDGVVTYTMRLDVATLASRNGTSRDGRQATVDTAKLYLLAMAASLEELAPGQWKLSVELVGLPSQTGLTGTRLYATTSWPYTARSALLASYRDELIDTEGGCR